MRHRTGNSQFRAIILPTLSLLCGEGHVRILLKITTCMERIRQFFINTIIGGGAVLLLSYTDLRLLLVLVSIAILVVGIAVWELSKSQRSIADRLTRLEERFRTYETTPSYRLEIIVIPDWRRIIEFVAERDHVTYDEVSKSIGEQDELAKATDRRRNGYRFIIFHDGMSGMETIWSDAHCMFVDFPRIRVTLAKFELPHERIINNALIVSPGRVGFTRENNVVLDEDLIGEIPFTNICSLLIEIARHDRNAVSRVIHRFPGRLKEKLDELGVSYEPIERYRADPNLFVDIDEQINSSPWAQKLAIALRISRTSEVRQVGSAISESFPCLRSVG